MTGSTAHHEAHNTNLAEYEKPPIPGEQKSTSLAFVQLEKHNERLKEALIRRVVPANRQKTR